MKRSKINILLLLIITTVGCSTTRIDEEVNTAFTFSGDESIVLLSNSYHTGKPN
jgi:hypothetical protein